ncbi:hypothetical protein J6590_042851 [Homalodisca vitripennis]|nr:hypothetical protein J6590_042851 [Homalodisca vitripennis]
MKSSLDHLTIDNLTTVVSFVASNRKLFDNIGFDIAQAVPKYSNGLAESAKISRRCYRFISSVSRTLLNPCTPEMEGLFPLSTDGFTFHSLQELPSLSSHPGDHDNQELRASKPNHGTLSNINLRKGCLRGSGGKQIRVTYEFSIRNNGARSRAALSWCGAVRGERVMIINTHVSYYCCVNLARLIETNCSPEKTEAFVAINDCGEGFAKISGTKGFYRHTI